MDPREDAPDDSDAAESVALEEALRRRRSGGDPVAETLLKVEAEKLNLELRHLRLKHFGERLNVGLKFLTITVGAVLAAGFLALAWSAHQAHGLVVEPFHVAPELASHMDGNIVASRVIDRLSEMQAHTDTARAPSTFADDWGDDVKVEIPEAGISLGDLHRYLRFWLGHETRITGSLYRTPKGLAVALRVGAQPAVVVEGGDKDIDGLIGRAADAAYAQSQPYRHAHFLFETGHRDQAIAETEMLVRRGSALDRRWAYSFWGALLADAGDLEGAVGKLRTALAMDPKMAMAWQRLAEVQEEMGHAQSARDAWAKVPAALRASRAEMDKRAADQIAQQAAAALKTAAGDYEGAATELTEAASLPEYQHHARIAPYRAARLRALAHDPGPARALDVPRPDDVTHLSWAMARAAGDAAIDDWAAARTRLTTLRQTATGWSPDPLARRAVLQLTPWLAEAEARSGDLASAKALIGTTAQDCYDCLRARAKIAALAGEWAEAERWALTAIRQARDLPFAYADYGDILLAKGDLKQAEAAFDAARARGPKWADPLEREGEILLRRGEHRAAARRFAQAERFAPQWGRLHLKWGEALAAQGRREEARTKWRAAAAMDLSPQDRADVESKLGWK